MPLLRRLLTVALLGAALSSSALAQSIQLGAGQVLGNDTAAARPGKAVNVSPLLDRALGSTRGAILERSASGWAILAPGAAGLAFVSAGAGADPLYGVVGLNGGGCNVALTASNGGILYSTATACAILSGSATARQMLQSGASAAPAWSTSVWPATTTINQLLYSDAANNITGLATAAGGLLGTSSGGVPSITPTPVLGVAGSAIGSIGFQNVTSGTITLQPATGALGASVITLPAITDTMAGRALANGGTNATLIASNGGLVYSTAAALEILSGTATANQIPLSGASSAPAWSTATYPATAAAGTILAAGTSNVISATATPTLGANGGTGGQITLSGSTSGSAAIRVAAAAGTGTIFQLPADNGTNTYVLQTNGAGITSWVSPAGGGTVTTLTAGTAITLSSGATCTTTCTINVDKATAGNLQAGTSNKALTADNIFDAEVTITYAASQTFDFSTFLNGRVTLTGNITSLTCSNIKESQSGTITLVQDATGSRTMVAGWCSQFRWANGARGILSTAVNAIDALFYQCISTTICYVSLAKAQAN